MSTSLSNPMATAKTVTGDSANTVTSSSAGTHSTAPTNTSSSSTSQAASMKMMPPRQRPQHQVKQQSKLPQQQPPASVVGNGAAAVLQLPNVMNNSMESINQLFQMAVNFPNNQGNAAVMQSLAAGFGQQPPQPSQPAAASQPTSTNTAPAVPPFMGNTMPQPAANAAMGNPVAAATPPPMMNPLEQLIQGMGMAHLAQTLLNGNGTNTFAAPVQNVNRSSNGAFPQATSSLSGSSSDNFAVPKQQSNLKSPPPSGPDAAPTAIASAASTSESKQEEAASTSLPDTIILPCRARGMPLDHNFRVRCFVLNGNDL